MDYDEQDAEEVFSEGGNDDSENVIPPEEWARSTTSLGETGMRSMMRNAAAQVSPVGQYEQPLDMESSPVGGQADSPMNQDFSVVIYDLLVSFENLQNQLVALLTPASLALNSLLCRLRGVHKNLMSLVDINLQASQYSEADRLRHLASVIDATIDADLEDEENVIDDNDGYSLVSGAGFPEQTGGSFRLLCGRGRRRIDNCAVIADQVRQAVKELQRLTMKAKLHQDFTGAQALDAMAGGKLLLLVLNSISYSALNVYQ